MKTGHGCAQSKRNSLQCEKSFTILQGANIQNIERMKRKGQARKEKKLWAREIAEQLRTLTNLAEDPSLISNIYMRHFTTACNSSSRGFKAFFF